MSEPTNNVESLLTAILKNDSSYLVVPQSRVEELLLAIYKNGGGGGGGSDITRYEVEQMLLDKVDKKLNYSLVSNSEIERLAGVDNYDDKSIRDELGKKVQKENGYSLILNTDYDNFKKLENYDDSELRGLINDISNDLGLRVPNDRTIAGKKLDKNISVDELLKALNLDKVNNTSDIEKPISTATQTALDQKVDETELLSTISASSTTQIRDSKTVEFDGTGKNLEKLVIEGKTSQDGTPTPSAPVEIKGVGDGGWNIMPFAKKETKKVGNITVDSDGLGTYHIYGSNSSGTQNITFDIDSFVIPTAVGKSGKGCLYYNNTAANGLNSIYFLNSGASVDYYSMSPVNRVISTYDDLGGKTVNQIRFAIGATGTIDFKVSLMVTNDGKTDHEFVPYGKYKIPISSGGKSTNIYLNAPLFDGEKVDVVSSVAEKKYGFVTFDGSEDWKYENISVGDNYYVSNLVPDSKPNTGVQQSHGTGKLSPEKENIYISSGKAINFQNQSFSGNVVNFKAWLKAQYDAGTPVQVKYPLATDTKETFDGVEIPTSIGKNTLSVDTDVTPAKVEVTSFGEYYSKSEVDKMLQPLSVTTYTKNDSFVKSEALSGLTVRDETMLQSNSISWAIILHLTGITIDANTNTIIGTMPNPPKHSFSEMVTVSKSDNTSIISNLVKITFGSSGNVTIESPVAISNGRINTSRYTTANF